MKTLPYRVYKKMYFEDSGDEFLLAAFSCKRLAEEYCKFYERNVPSLVKCSIYWKDIRRNGR